MGSARTWKSFDWTAMNQRHAKGADLGSGEQREIGVPERRGHALGRGRLPAPLRARRLSGGMAHRPTEHAVYKPPSEDGGA